MSKLHVCRTIHACRAYRASKKGRIGYVPTMGGLHAGHIQLLTAAHLTPVDHLFTSIFVNPLQFSSTDTDGGVARYPKTLESDIQKLELNKVDMLFAPLADEMIGQNEELCINSGIFEERAEGRARPGFCNGVATILTKMFHIIQPTDVFMGAKDALQCVLVQRLVRDFNFDITVHIIPTVREEDGLALSTRNQYLSIEERKVAKVVYAALREAQRVFEQAGRNVPATVLRKVVQDMYVTEPMISKVEYISIASKKNMEEMETVTADGAILSVALFINQTKRLIDNIYI